MAKKSKLGDMMREDLVQSARRMTPEQRLESCVNLSLMVSEIHRAGEAYRKSSRHSPPRGRKEP